MSYGYFNYFLYIIYIKLNYYLTYMFRNLFNINYLNVLFVITIFISICIKIHKENDFLANRKKIEKHLFYFI